MVGVLHTGNFWQPELLGTAHEFGNTPRRFIAQSDVAHLADFDQLCQYLQLFGDGSGLAFLCNVVAGGAEHRYVAIRPMNLVQVHIVCLQAAQAAVDGGGKVLAVDARCAAYPVEAASRTCDLRGDDELVALLSLEPSTDVSLGAMCRLGSRCDRVHFGGVYEVDAAGHGEVQLRVGIRFAVLFAESHGAQCQCREVQIAAAQFSVFHVTLKVFDMSILSLHRASICTS